MQFLTFLHTVIRYRVFLSNTNILQADQLNPDEALASTTTLRQRGYESNGNEGGTFQGTKTGALQSDPVQCHTQNNHFGENLTPLQLT